MGQFFVDLALVFSVGNETYETAALAHRSAATAILDSVFQVSDARVLVSLSNRHSALYATAGYPAITVPVGLRANGMPVGVTLIGRAGADAELLGFAYALEQATKLRVAPPEPIAA